MSVLLITFISPSIITHYSLLIVKSFCFNPAPSLKVLHKISGSLCISMMIQVTLCIIICAKVSSAKDTVVSIIFIKLLVSDVVTMIYRYAPMSLDLKSALLHDIMTEVSLFSTPILRVISSSSNYL